MTSLVSPGLSFQTVLWFSGRKCKKTTKWSGMTSLGSPGLSSQHVSGFSGRKGRKIPETDRHDKPGKPRLVIPISFGIFWPERDYKTPKQTGMTSLGSPGSSSQLVSGFSGRKRPKKPEMDWYDKPRKPRLVVAPVHFGVFGPKGATTKRNGTGSPGLSSQSISGFCGVKGHTNPKRTGMTSFGRPGLSSQSVSDFPVRKGLENTRNGMG